MPRTAITAQETAHDGLTATYEAANVDGNSLTWGARRLLHVKNASAGAVTVTVPTPATVGGLDVADQAVAVAAGTETFIGPFPAANGNVHVDYSAVASVTVAALDVARI